MARVKLITDKADVAPEHLQLFDTLAARRGRISGPSTVVFHSPELARPWNEVSEFLHGRSIVEPRASELAVCATARERDCAYVWNAHVPLARKAGVADTTIDVVRARQAPDALPAGDVTVVRYVQQLLRDHRVESAVFDQLLGSLGAQGLVELTGWIGRYAALSGVLNAFEVTPASPVDVLPSVPAAARTPGRARAPLATPRVTPITRRDQVAEEHRAIFDAVAEGRGTVRGPFAVMMHSPRFCRVMLDVGSYLRFRSRIPPAPMELAILATAREKDCPYVWAAHAPLARKAGTSEAAIAAVRERGDLAGLSSDEHDVVDYVRQLHRTHRVAATLFDRLRDRHGVPWLVELTCLIGHYGIVAGILNAFEVASAPDADPLPVP